MSLPSLDEIAALIDDSTLPPVHLWNPDHEGSIDITIRRDGSWWHEGGEIARHALVKLFASILRRDFRDFEDANWLPGGGEYALITPVERLKIVVQDAPFLGSVITRYDTDQTLVLSTNVDENIIISETHPLSVVYDSIDADPRPYVLARDNMPALLTRNVWNQLAEHAVAKDGVYGVFSAGTFFALENITS